MRNLTLSLALLLPLGIAACGDKDDDTGTSDEADSDPDSDTDSDTDADTDSDTDSDTDADPENLLANAGFEDGWDGSWLVYPTSLENLAAIADGDAMYPDDATWASSEGTGAFKVWGQYTGGFNETPVYQEFTATVGDTYTFEGYAYMYSNDAITEERTYGALWIKYFDDSYNYLGEDSSDPMTSTSTADSWTHLTATGTVPDGATKVQASIQFMHCVEETADCWDGGGLYFDDMLFYMHTAE